MVVKIAEHGRFRLCVLREAGWRRWQLRHCLLFLRVHLLSSCTAGILPGDGHLVKSDGEVYDDGSGYIVRYSYGRRITVHLMYSTKSNCNTYIGYSVDSSYGI